MDKDKAVWEKLQALQLVSAGPVEPTAIDSPWYVRFLLGLSAWVTAFFLLGTVISAFTTLMDSDAGSVVVGLGMIAGAWMLFRGKDNDFANQFALALSFAGQFLCLFPIFRALDSFNDAEIYLLITLMQASLAFLMPNYIHRLMSALFAAMALGLLLFSMHIYFMYTGLMLAICAMLWLNEFSWSGYYRITAPIAYGLTLALLYMSGSRLFGELRAFAVSTTSRSAHGLQPWMGEMLTGLVLLVIIWQLLKRYQVKIPGRVSLTAFAAGIIIALLSAKASGISTGVAIILLGYANANRLLTSLGFISLLFYISAYYYSLHVTLLDKSLMLAGLGLFLLAVSALLPRFLSNNDKVRS